MGTWLSLNPNNNIHNLRKEVEWKKMAKTMPHLHTILKNSTKRPRRHCPSKNMNLISSLCLSILIKRASKSLSSFWRELLSSSSITLTIITEIRAQKGTISSMTNQSLETRGIWSFSNKDTTYSASMTGASRLTMKVGTLSPLSQLLSMLPTESLQYLERAKLMRWTDSVELAAI